MDLSDTGSQDLKDCNVPAGRTAIARSFPAGAVACPHGYPGGITALPLRTQTRRKHICSTICKRVRGYGCWIWMLSTHKSHGYGYGYGCGAPTSHIAHVVHGIESALLSRRVVATDRVELFT
eukprot:1138961-Pelagomonas_calceolata.AAC.4